MVLVSQIGPGASKALQSKGVTALTLSGSIDKALTAYGKRGQLLESIIPGSAQGCQPPAGGGSCGCSGGCN